MTILEAIQLSSDFLKRKNIDSPRLNAELLLADILNVQRLELYMRFDKPLSEIEVNKYREYIVRRGKNEPLQYILGYQNFYGLNFIVNPNVLIPRSDTEILVEESIKLIKEISHPVSILEVGSGSGNIAIAIAKNCDNVNITSIDVSNEAIELAKTNAEKNSVSEKIKFICIGIESFKSPLNEFDFVISNPPYIAQNELTTLHPEVYEHEPQIALTDGGDGFDFFRIISARASEYLKSKGKIIFEVGIHQANDVKNILEQNSFTGINFIKDYSGIDRVVIGEKL